MTGQIQGNIIVITSEKTKDFLGLMLKKYCGDLCPGCFLAEIDNLEIWELLKTYNNEVIENVAWIWTGANDINQVSTQICNKIIDFNSLLYRKENGTILVLEIQFQNGYGIVGTQMELVTVGKLKLILAISKCWIPCVTLKEYLYANVSTEKPTNTT